MTRVILVKKQSTWEQYRLNRSQFGKLSEVSRIRMEGSHARHTRTVNLTIAVLSELGVKPWVVEGAGQRFKAGHGDLVITVGGKCRESFAAAKWRANRSSNGPMLPDLYDTKELAMEALASPANAQSSSESDGFLELGLPGGHGSDLQYHMVSIPILS